MLTAVLVGFVAALGFAFAGNHMRKSVSYWIPFLPASLFVYFALMVPPVLADGAILFQYNWAESMGVSMNFRLDILSLLFALLITGIGTLVFLYSTAYMRDHKQLDRFYGYLSLFMASMLGLVLAENLITLFVFWEMTSISSFFLIGFNYRDKKAGRAALTALCITGGGGLLLLVALLMMGQIAGTYSFTEILQSGDLLRDSLMYPVILLLLFAGVFTKSAQFPFHFWLPEAMRAPTPVSTYLHSATMVKAGIYLLARFHPVLEGPGLWQNTLLIVGGITMLFGAIHALLRTDMKAILAYTTISALGIMVFLTGLGTPAALAALGLFILVHALYKSSMFLLTGVLDKTTGTRNLTQLRGLGKYMPLVFAAGMLAALSNAGLLPALGYHSKHLFYEASLGHITHSTLLTGLALVTNILLLAAGLLIGLRPFTGQPSHQPGERVSSLLWLPTLLPGLLAVAAGLAPVFMEKTLTSPFTNELTTTAFEGHLHLWGGFDQLLMLSVMTLAAGLIVYWKFSTPKESRVDLVKREKLSPGGLMYKAALKLRNFFKTLIHILQNGYLRYYTSVIIGFLVLLMGLRIQYSLEFNYDLERILDVQAIEAVTMLVMVISVVVSVVSKSRLLAVASLGAVGLCICLIFLYFSAPDLAMTQFTIDTLTVVLFVLLLNGLPAYLLKADQGIHWRDLILAGGFGTLIFVFTLEVLNQPTDSGINAFYAENAYLLAKGKNVVNVILVDFRGVDTLIEIVVLAVAGLGVFSLIKLKVTDAPE
ncbi:MAG: DUF4040 domain-containing protein [Saprospirales bacterium]|nr:MAG: DUF4040 domain-containing protein [Saprospirales bacterium]